LLWEFGGWVRGEDAWERKMSSAAEDDG
jgi:hypothetical protein